MSTLIQDLRYGIRMLTKNPGFTTAAVLTLALGIGANTAIFSVVNATLFRDLPFRDSQRIVVVGQEWMGGYGDFSPADFLDVEDENRIFDRMAVYRSSSSNLSAGEKPEHVTSVAVTTDFFRLLGVEPVLGRAFLPEDSGHAGNRAAILSYSLWQRYFGKSPTVLGEKVVLNAELFTVVGVMPRSFGFPDGADLWVAPRYAVPEHPLRPNVDPATLRGSHYFEHIIAHLRPGVTMEQAQVNLAVVFQNIVRAHPDSDLRGAKPWIQPLQEDEVGDVRPALLVLLGAAGLVLMIACANVAILTLARGVARRKEIAVREALGASHAKVVRQLLTESVLLALIGGGLGVLVALWGFAPLAALVLPESPGFVRPTIDLPALGFTLLVSVFAGVAFGLAPALADGRAELTETLKEGGRASVYGASGRHRGQEILVVAETALALMLLVGAGLLLRSFIRLLGVDEGFDAGHVLTMQIFLPQARYLQPAQRDNFAKQVLANIKGLPGASFACIVHRLPLIPGDSTRSIQIEGRSYSPDVPAESVEPNYSVITPDFLSVLRIPLLAGRNFTETDNATSPPVFIINRTMARTFWPGQDAVGKRLRFGPDQKWGEVVGVVGDVRQHQLGEAPAPMMYAPYAQDPFPFMDIAVRTASEPASLASSVARAIQNVDKDEAVYNVRTLDEVVSRSISRRRFNTLLLGLLASLALLLTAIGIFGVISFAVTQRTHEIGVRMALGAERYDVLRLVVRQGLLLALTGVAIGLVAAWGLTRLMAALLYGVRPTDPATFLLVSLLLVGVAMLACYLPARRATKVDPMVALRYE
ncbi:MAG TPA: ABC transporter permease [Terriglobia bacterium]|nr:ABC transporter permease [Terriglobia bacterium]